MNPAEPRVVSSGLTDVGQARSHNEDCFEIDADRNLYVVADGMGGHRHGEVASRIAVDSIGELIDSTQDASEPPSQDGRSPHANQLKKAIEGAHQRVLDAIAQDVALLGMGTTVVGISLNDGVAAVAHVGDSRAYRVRDGDLELLTRDHTWVQEQLTAGLLNEDEAKVHPLRNVVTRALGGAGEVEVDVLEVVVAPGDRYLLCSDGLTGMVTDGDIREHLASSATPDEICSTLVEMANKNGGLDNVTVVVVEIQAPE